jgi:hypothetical protein
MVFFAQYLSGARESALISLVFLIGGLIIFLLSLKLGVRDTSKWDRFLFALALSAIAIWALTRNNEVAIWLTLVINALATIMIALKVSVQPNSEAPFPWALAASAYAFSLLTLVGRPIDILYVRPGYGLLCSLGLVGFIYFQKLKAQQKEA